MAQSGRTYSAARFAVAIDGTPGRVRRLGLGRRALRRGPRAARHRRARRQAPRTRAVRTDRPGDRRRARPGARLGARRAGRRGQSPRWSDLPARLHQPRAPAPRVDEGRPRRDRLPDRRRRRPDQRQPPRHDPPRSDAARRRVEQQRSARWRRSARSRSATTTSVWRSPGSRRRVGRPERSRRSPSTCAPPPTMRARFAPASATRCAWSTTSPSPCRPPTHRPSGDGSTTSPTARARSERRSSPSSRPA